MTSRKKWTVGLIVTALAAAGVAGFGQFTPAPPPLVVPQETPVVNPSPVAQTGCNPALWSRVYKPQRLIVHDQCTTVTGIIMDASNGRFSDGTRHEADGDTHGWLKLDPQFSSMINPGNISNEQGNLVFEIVCHFPITQQDAIAPCGSFHDMQVVPPVGSHVSITGSFVLDTNHSRWNEIHPVSSVKKIP